MDSSAFDGKALEEFFDPWMWFRLGCGIFMFGLFVGAIIIIIIWLIMR